jgi:predicted kinase
MDKQKIILLGGFGGSGKSTTGWKLHESLESSALFEADHLFFIRPWEIGEKLGRIKLKNSLDVMRNFLNEEYEHVICVGLVWSQQELDAVAEAFGQQADIHMFWLHTSKEVRFKRVLARGEEGDTEEFLEMVEKTLKYPWPLTLASGKVYKIETDDKTPERVLATVKQHLAS